MRIESGCCLRCQTCDKLHFILAEPVDIPGVVQREKAGKPILNHQRY